MRTGILYPDMQTSRADIRFDCEDFYGGLSCGTTMDVWLNEVWTPTRIELGCKGWFLDGIKTGCIWGLKVRI